MAIANGNQGNSTNVETVKTIINVGGAERGNEPSPYFPDEMLAVGEVLSPLVWLKECQISVRDVIKATNSLMLEKNRMGENGYAGMFSQLNKRTGEIELFLIFNAAKCPFINTGAKAQGNILRAIANKMGRPEMNLEGLFRKLNGITFNYKDSTRMVIMTDNEGNDNNPNINVAVKCELEDLLYSIHGYSILEDEAVEIKDIRFFRNEQSHKVEDNIINYKLVLAEGVETISNRYGMKFKAKNKGRFSGTTETFSK